MIKYKIQWQYSKRLLDTFLSRLCFSIRNANYMKSQIEELHKILMTFYHLNTYKDAVR